MKLIDTGLQALIAPREDGGGSGVGLVIGALAAVAGLAVLKRSTLEALKDAPMLDLDPSSWADTVDFLVGRRDSLYRDGGFGDRVADLVEIGVREGVYSPNGWLDIPHDDYDAWRAKQLAVIADELLEKGDPRGVVLSYGKDHPYWLGPRATTRDGDAFAEATCINPPGELLTIEHYPSGSGEADQLAALFAPKGVTRAATCSAMCCGHKELRLWWRP